MEFALVGINYKQASLSVREKCVFSDTQKMAMYVALQQAAISESVIVSTCNRSEIYFLFEDEQEIETVKKLFLDFFEQPNLRQFLITLKGKEALIYLYEVSNGLHSLVLGEDQIAGQIIDSEEFARHNGQSRKLMNHIFRDVISCTKKAKAQFHISEHPLSLSYTAVNLLKKRYGVMNKTAMVIGSGKMSALALGYLLDQKISRIFLANRSKENAEKLKTASGEADKITLIPFRERYQYISQCDFVITATSSPHSILNADRMPALSHEIIMVDMASPRDISTDMHHLPYVFVYDMDDLERIVNENHQIRQDTVKDIRKLIQEEASKTAAWLNHVELDTAFYDLQERIRQVSEETYELLKHKLDLSEHDKYVLKKTLKASMQRLMLEPLITLKQQTDAQKQENYQKVIKELFHL